ncbi:MAG: sigma-54-dependent Fis family transcriptional regulator [Labilithrix sp.]|nr:sigma-54-dependent Fis family transcriptional regulator [Labilithrix sp.]
MQARRFRDPREHSTVRRKRFARAPLEEARKTPFVLAVVDGSDAGATLSIDGGFDRAVIGTGLGCTLRLADEGVARCHASIHAADGHLVIVDVGGTGTVMVNGAAVREAFLRGGEIIRLGDTLIEVRREAEAATRASGFGRLFGKSTAMQEIFQSLAALAALDNPLLLHGEAGTGKELAAREIHRAGRRASGPFVEITGATDAAAMAESLEAARGGVLFIDEIAALDADSQRLVREALSRPADLRVIAATRRDLGREVTVRGFDAVLALMLAGGRVALPALRDRDGDVSHLARAFWREAAANDGGDPELPVDFLPRFDRYAWPGNVRELKAAVLARRTVGDLFESRQKPARPDEEDFLDAIVDEGLSFPEARVRVVREFESRYVERALSRHVTKTGAARASGLQPRHFDIIRARSRRACPTG